MHVISCILSGRLADYQNKSSFPNSPLWYTLKTLIASCLARGLTIIFEWVPRCLNREADELANAVLDCRVTHTSVLSEQTSDIDTTHLPGLILRLLLERDHPVLHHIPDGLGLLYTSFAHRILERYDANPTLCRVTFLILPHIVSLHTPVVQNNNDFKQLRSHLQLCQSTRYFDECLQVLHDILTNPPPPALARPSITPDQQKAQSAKRIAALCKRGIFHKCLPNDNSYIDYNPSPEILAKVQAIFLDVDDCPQNLQCPEMDNTQVLSFSDVKLRIRKLKKHKSPVFTGFTRETLFPIFENCPSNIKTTLAAIFSSFINTSVSEVEKLLLRTSRLRVLRYHDDPEKVRPLILFDAISKLVWHIAMSEIDDPMIHRSAHCSQRKGGSQIAVSTIQLALDAGHVCISMDAQKAFPTICRKLTFQYFQQHWILYRKAFHMLNLVYGSPSQVNLIVNSRLIMLFIASTGVLQGCVSAGWVYTIGTLTPSLTYRLQIVQIADDVTIISKDSLSIVADVISAFKGIGQILTGNKLRVISPRPITASDLPLCIRHAKIVTTPTLILGALLVPQRHISTDIHHNAALAHKLAKLTERYRILRELPTPLQNKMLILRAITWNFLYHASCFGHLTSSFFDSIDDLQFRTWLELLKETGFSQRDIPDLHIHAFSPVEDGGWGLLPYSQLHAYLAHRSSVQDHEFLSRYNFATPHFAAPAACSLSVAWSSVFKEIIASCRVKNLSLSDSTYLRSSNFHSWLNTRPANSMTTMNDRVFTTAAGLRIGHLRPRPHICAATGINLISLSSREYFNHVMRCKSCGASQFYHRHEQVVHCICKTLRFHHITAQANPKGFALPNKTRGGADAHVFTTLTYAVDVAVVHGATRSRVTTNPNHTPGTNTVSRLRERFSDKIRDYKAHALATTFTTIPFIMSVQGIYSVDTIDLLDEWFQFSKQRNTLRKALFAHTQIALFQGVLHGLDLLHAQSPSLVSTDTRPHVRRALVNSSRPNLNPHNPTVVIIDELEDITDDELTLFELQQQLPAYRSSTPPPGAVV